MPKQSMIKRIAADNPGQDPYKVLVRACIAAGADVAVVAQQLGLDKSTIYRWVQ